MLERLVARWVALAARAPRRVTATAVLLAVALAFLLPRVDFETDIRALVPTSSGRVLERVDRLFGLREQAFLVVESPGEGRQEELIAFAEALRSHLGESELIADVQFGYADMEREVLQHLAPYAARYLRGAARQELDALLSPEDLRQRAERQIARLSLPGFGESEERVRLDPLDLGAALAPTFEALGGAYRFAEGSPYFISTDGRALLIRLRGTRSLDDVGAVVATADAIDGAIDAARRNAGAADLRVYRGGGYFLGRESQRAIQHDLVWSLSVSLVLVLGLVAWTLRSVTAGLLVFPVLTLGVAGGLGLLCLWNRSPAILALGSAAIQIGLGVDFAIHFFLRSRDAASRATSSAGALHTAARAAGPGLVCAAATTALAFLAFVPSRFSFLSEMGQLTALGIAVTLVATLTCLPAWSRLWLGSREHLRSRPVTPPRQLGVDPIVHGVLRAPRTVLALALPLTLGCAVWLVLRPPSFEADLQKIHAQDSPALQAQRRVREVFGGSPETLLLLVEAESEEALVRSLRRLRVPFDQLVEKGTLSAWISAASFLPRRDAEQAALERFAQTDSEALRDDLRAALSDAGFDADAFRGAIDRVVDATTDRRPLTLEALRELGLAEWIEPFATGASTGSGGGTRVYGLVHLFMGTALWEPAERRDALAALRDAARDAGVPDRLAGGLVTAAETIEVIGAEMLWIGGGALAAAALVVLAQFRRPGVALLVLTPVGLTCVWTAVLYDGLGYGIHFMNAAVLPMVIGIGIDDGIHIVHRFRQLQRDGNGRRSARDLVRETYAVTGTGVLLTSLTTMLAFGSLATSRNGGLASIGVLSAVGVGGALLASLTVLPSLLYLVAARSAREASVEGDDREGNADT